MTIERFNPPGAAYPAMSQALRCGDWILVSGQVALQGGKVVGVGDGAAQARQCFANIEAALAEAGATLNDVVNLRCYLVDQSAYAGYGEVKKELFSAHPPASTALIVKGLLLPDLLMEIEATAFKPR